MSVDAADGRPEWLSLDPDEEIVWTGEPAFETLYGTIASGLLLLPVLIGAVILLAVPLAYLRIGNTDYVATTDSLYVKTGIFSTNIETVDLDRIQNTEYTQSFWGKQFGYGSIAISTAGSGGAEISFDGIPDASAVRDRITELQRRHRDRGSGEASDDGAPAGAEQLAELVAEVRATREAFERIEERLLATDRGAGADGTDADGTAAGSETGAEPGTDAGN
jgi:uncharacterized membrane protein YdbT with pleckstrin-like domain